MPTFTASLICITLFSSMVGLTFAGLKIGRRQREPEGSRMIDGAVFALLGLLLGFAFAGATSRLDARRALVVDETNAIEEAYQRIDLLPVDRQEELRALFRAYLDARVETHALISEGRDAAPAIAAAVQLQQRIWRQAVAAVLERDTGAAIGTLDAIQEMTRLTTARFVALNTHTPNLILALLLGVALLSAFVAGYVVGVPGARSVLHGAFYAAAVSLTIFVVLDLDNPQGGIIRLDEADQVFEGLRGQL